MSVKVFKLNNGDEVQRFVLPARNWQTATCPAPPPLSLE
jgi:hypothetical protein